MNYFWTPSPICLQICLLFIGLRNGLMVFALVVSTVAVVMVVVFVVIVIAIVFLIFVVIVFISIGVMPNMASGLVAPDVELDICCQRTP